MKCQKCQSQAITREDVSNAWRSHVCESYNAKGADITVRASIVSFARFIATRNFSLELTHNNHRAAAAAFVAAVVDVPSDDAGTPR